MLQAIKGYFEKGQIIMEEEAPVQNKTDVIITFLTDQHLVSKTKRVPGALKGRVSLPDDFNEPLDDLKDYM
jgi:ligand-binding sensor protein